MVHTHTVRTVEPSSSTVPGRRRRTRKGGVAGGERARTNNVGRSRACGTFRSRSVAVVRRISRFGGRSVFCFVGCCWLPFVPPSIPRHEPHAVQSCFILLSLFFPVPLPSIRCDALRVGPFCSLRCRSFLFSSHFFFWGRVECRAVFAVGSEGVASPRWGGDRQYSAVRSPTVGSGSLCPPPPGEGRGRS